VLGGSRIDRVNALVQQELGEMIVREIEMPDGVLATITRVACSPDLEYAKVWISVLPTDRAASALEHLERATGTLQHLLLRKLSIKPVPKIRFFLDDSENRAARIETILDSLSAPE